MEFPNVGKHCSKHNCNKLDFLPIKCDACSAIFCDEHYFYTKHNCVNAHQKDNQVPVCPLCNKPIPVAQGLEPDRIVGAHIDNDCQSDPAVNKRKVFANKCSVKGCKVKEIIPVVCNECGMNFCLKHRHSLDHHCAGKNAVARHKALNAALGRKTQNFNVENQIQGNMSEDEAFAKALALSMQESTRNSKTTTQEESDLALARQLQASEYQNTTSARSEINRDRCVVM